VGIGVSLAVLDGCLLLSVSREEMRLTVMEKQFKVQQQEQAEHRVIEMQA